MVFIYIFKKKKGVGYLSPSQRLVVLAHSFSRHPHAHPASLAGPGRENVYCEAKRARLVSTEVRRWLNQQKVSGGGSKVPAELLHPQPFPTHPTLSFFPHRDRWSTPAHVSFWLTASRINRHSEIFLYFGNDFCASRTGEVWLSLMVSRLGAAVSGLSSQARTRPCPSEVWRQQIEQRWTKSRQTTDGLLQPSLALPHIWPQLHPPEQRGFRKNNLTVEF